MTYLSIVIEKYAKFLRKLLFGAPSMTLFGDYRSKNFCRLDVLIDIQPFSITLSDNQGNQELLVVKDKVGRPPGEFGVSKSMGCDIFPSVF